MYVFTSSQLVEDGSLVDPEVEGDCSPLELLDGDVVELVEAEVLGLLQPRSDRPQEVLGRHHHLVVTCTYYLLVSKMVTCRK